MGAGRVSGAGIVVFLARSASEGRGLVYWNGAGVVLVAALGVDQLRCERVSSTTVGTGGRRRGREVMAIKVNASQGSFGFGLEFG